MQPPAYAQESGDGDFLDAGSVDGSAAATDTGGVVGVASTGPGEAGPGAGGEPCITIVGDPALVADLGHLLPAGIPLPPADPDPEFFRPWVTVVCTDPDTPAGTLAALFQLGDPPPVAPMVEHARRALVIPLPVAQWSPPADAFQVVGIETWTWIDPAGTGPYSGTACIEPDDYACATIVATFATLTADPADGTAAIDCDGPGVPYDHGRSEWDQMDDPHCGHVYLATPDDGDTYPATVTTVWDLTWSCAYDADLDGIREATCGGGPLEAIGRTGVPVDLEVRDYQAIAD